MGEVECMTREHSCQIEELLAVWYAYERAYSPPLGAPRATPACRGYESGDIYATGEDRDERLARFTSEIVGACVDELPLRHRSAIGVHCQRKPRPEAVAWHAAYQAAKAALYPLLRSRGLLRDEA